MPRIPWDQLKFERDGDGFPIELGRGSFGAVFPATYMFQRVAVKLFGTGGLPPALAAQVEREAELQSRLAHENVVRIFGLAEERRPGFPLKFGIVLARLHEPLSALLARVASGAHGPPLEALPVEWRLRAIHELASGLAHLHGHRVVHGDLKPGNVLLTSPRAGCALQIADFGLAREGGTTLGSAASVRGTFGGDGLGGGGTVSWMAPELLAPSRPGVRPQRPTYRSDVFASAVVAWQLLIVSVAPYSGCNDEQVRANVLQGVRPDLGVIPTSGVPETLPALLASGWAQAPSDRPCRGGEFLEALHEVAAPSTGAFPLPPALSPQDSQAAGGVELPAAGASESVARAPELAEWQPGFMLSECLLCAVDGTPGVRLGCTADHALCLECALRTVRSELVPGAPMVRCPLCRAAALPVDEPVSEAAVAEVASWSASPARAGGLSAAVGTLRALAASELARFTIVEYERRWRQGEAARRAEAEAALPEGVFKRCPGTRADGTPCGEGIQHPRGHACHHIKPGSGCPTCSTHFCYRCLAPYNHGCPNRCPMFCTNDCDCPDCLECAPGSPCDECDNDGRCWVCQPDRRPPLSAPAQQERDVAAQRVRDAAAQREREVAAQRERDAVRERGYGGGGNQGNGGGGNQGNGYGGGGGGYGGGGGNQGTHLHDTHTPAMAGLSLGAAEEPTAEVRAPPYPTPLRSLGTLTRTRAQGKRATPDKKKLLFLQSSLIETKKTRVEK